MAVRFAVAEVYIENPELDEDGVPLKDEPYYKWVKSSIDLWQVQQVGEGWKKGTIELHYYSGDIDIIKGTFNDWYDKHTAAKQDELYIYRLPYLN